MWYSIKNATGFWQPFGAGMPSLLKVLAFHEQQDWFKYDKNIDVWMRTSTESLSIKHREF